MLGELPALVSGWLRIARRLMARRGRPPVGDAERLAEAQRLYEDVRPGRGGAPELTAWELLESRQPTDIVVDVRSDVERAVSMIPGAIPLAELDRQAARGRRVIVYCTIGWRSGHEVNRLRRFGLDVHNLSGGVLVWTHAGGTLTRDGVAVRDVHVYGAPWSFARSDFTAVW